MTDDRSELGLPPLSIEEERRLHALLQSACSPRAIDEARHERLLAAALEDPLAAASPREIAESERLRRALDGDGDCDGDHLDLVLARALAAAHAPSELLAEPVTSPARQAWLRRARAHGNVRQLGVGRVLAGLAAAAALLLVIGTRPSHAPPHATSFAPTMSLPTLALAQSRSTAPLFRNAASELPSSRIDRIASARERDLRANRYAEWGVR